jgi:hypothetical protein
VLEDVARFIGVDFEHRRLPPDILVDRIGRVLAVARSHVRQLPPEAMDRKLPGRDRSYRELAHHIFRIPEAFLEVAAGGRFTVESLNVLPPAEMRTPEQLDRYGAGVAAAVEAWWPAETDRLCAREVETYYGRKPLHVVLERTTWHSAQHTRQLEMVLGLLALPPSRPLGAAELAGLPLPENVWDNAAA